LKWTALVSTFASTYLLLASPANSQILNLQELNTEDLRGLDRQRTVVIMPGGVLEEHGPYLPAFTDGYVNEYRSRMVAESIAARPGWTALMFPTLPLGDGGGNQVGKQQVFPPTFHVHFATLRAVYMDLASELGEAGFRWIFVISGHGALRHQQALDQASDFFTDTYGGSMVHLTGLVLPSPVVVNLNLTDEERRQNGFDVHAGMNETSQLLFLHPRLVSPAHRKAEPQAGTNWRQLVDKGTEANWPGYFGSPALAEAWRGAALVRADAQALSDLAMRILDGFDWHTLKRRADAQLTDDAIKEYNAAADQHARVMAEKQSAWLRRKGLQ
jgi:creatinine amidohydrolase/Fe(II)-dependent formamide hydrolase-like protein